MSSRKQDDFQIFADAIGRFGARIEEWPANERRIAEALLAQQRPEALQELDRAARLEALLAQAVRVEPPPHLTARILDRTAERRGASPINWLSTLLVRHLTGAGAVAAIVLLACGVLIGVTQDVSADDDASDVVAVLHQVGFGPDEDL